MLSGLIRSASGTPLCLVHTRLHIPKETSMAAHRSSGTNPCPTKLLTFSLADWEPARDHDRRAGDARADVDSRQVRAVEAPQGRPHHRLAAHDHSDRRAHRDAGRTRRHGPLGIVQHLLHAGPRRCRNRRRRRPRLRLEGRDARGILVVHRSGAPPRRRSRTAAGRR